MGTGQYQLGKYQLREQLGRGGMAEVWKAWDSQLERFVAIKLLHADLQHDPDFMVRFVREARVIASLHNPNIINIHDFQISQPPETESTLAYMVMDYVEGGTLTQYINATSMMGKYPSAAGIVDLFSSISQAIDYAHQRGMIHRDIKPANILLDKPQSVARAGARHAIGEPILTDFGIVKLLGSANATLSGGFWLGTPLYISPEQAQGQSGNERSDIYSLGVILYEICTGVRPFTGDSTYAIIMQHVSAQPIPPEQVNPNISPALSKVIMCSLAKDPAERFASASEMATALAQSFNIGVPGNLAPFLHRAGTMNESPKNVPAPNQPPTAPFSTPVLPLSIGLSTPQNVRDDAIPSSEKGAFYPGDNNTEHNQGPATRSPLLMTPASHSVEMDWEAGSRRNRPRKRALIALLAILVVALIGSGLGVFLLHSSQKATPPVATVVGHALFISTGQLNIGTTQGLNDEVQINLSRIQTVEVGKSYYAWLLGDNKQNPAASLLLGKLPVNSGSVTFLYPGDQAHTDLFATFSRLLITEEDANSVPTQPATDRSAWRYYAELPQAPNSLTGTRAIDYLRFMLSDDPLIEAFGIHGGLSESLYNDLQRVVELADNARNSQNAATMRQQLIAIMDYIDGAGYVQQDVPPGTPLLADSTFSQVPLLNISTDVDQGNSGLLRRLEGRLSSLTVFSDISQSMNNLATQINLALSNNVEPGLVKVHQDAKQLLSMTSAQLLLPTSQPILIDMQTQVHNAFDGYTDLTTGIEQPGMAQISAELQRLATFDITSFKS